MLNAEGHRRLIGNDVAILFFLDENATQFDPTKVSDLGAVPQNFLVVQPVQGQPGQYRIASFSKSNIRPFLPEAPANVALGFDIAKDFIYSKCTHPPFSSP